MAEYHVTEQDQGMRIDQFLCKCQPDVSRSAIQKWIKDGNVLVQGKACKANYRINKGDTIALFVPEPVEVSIQPQDIPLDILYEDKDLLIVNVRSRCPASMERSVRALSTESIRIRPDP